MKNVVKLNTNEIIEAGAFFRFGYYDPEIPIKTFIENNILYDYEKGIRQTTITILPTDYYTIVNNNKKLDWALGDIVQIGNFICFYTKQFYYRTTPLEYVFYELIGNSIVPIWFEVVDRKVRYEGQIFIDLVLREVKNLTFS